FSPRSNNRFLRDSSSIYRNFDQYIKSAGPDNGVAVFPSAVHWEPLYRYGTRVQLGLAKKSIATRTLDLEQELFFERELQIHPILPPPDG
ncbi:MAG: hypothetical protein J2P21_13090, partial [Chloracidobacterium sp.]|nr:hypothetical protein [Chloracidobacterium sp.]